MPLRRRRKYNEPNLGSPSDGYSHTIHYDSSDHVKVLLQQYGGVWRKVLPHCVANVVVTAIILYLLKCHGIDITLSQYGHGLMSVLVGFLVISIRCSFNLTLYFELRGYLSVMYQSSRDLVQNACALTMCDTADAAREWRSDVAYQSIVLLQVVAAVLSRGSTNVNAWEIVAVAGPDREVLRRVPSIDGSCGFRQRDVHQHEWVYGLSTEYDENLMIPIRVVHRLKRTIVSQRTRLGDGGRLDSYQEQSLLHSTGDLMKGYHGIRKYLTTPFPFALVQMARTFLFFYIYSLPFALVGVTSKPFDSVLIFIITYGFIGLEYVSIELDDPFGDDPVDLPVIDETKSVLEDLLLAIHDSDGAEYAKNLQDKIRQQRIGDDQKHRYTEVRYTEESSLLA